MVAISWHFQDLSLSRERGHQRSGNWCSWLRENRKWLLFCIKLFWKVLQDMTSQYGTNTKGSKLLSVIFAADFWGGKSFLSTSISCSSPDNATESSYMNLVLDFLWWSAVYFNSFLLISVNSLHSSQNVSLSWLHVWHWLYIKMNRGSMASFTAFSIRLKEAQPR